MSEIFVRGKHLFDRSTSVLNIQHVGIPLALEGKAGSGRGAGGWSGYFQEFECHDKTSRFLIREK